LVVVVGGRRGKNSGRGRGRGPIAVVGRRSPCALSRPAKRRVRAASDDDDDGAHAAHSRVPTRLADAHAP